MRTNRRGLTVIGLVLILVAVGLIVFLLLRLRGGGEPAPADPMPGTTAVVPDTGLATAGALAARLDLAVPVDTVAQPRDTIVVRVRAATVAGTAVAAAQVLFSVTGGGTVEPQTATTGDAGEAEARWVLGGEPGAQTLRASLADGAAPPLTVTVHAGGAGDAR